MRLGRSLLELGRGGSTCLAPWDKAIASLTLSPFRMATSKLFVDQNYLARVEKGDWAKYFSHEGSQTLRKLTFMERHHSSFAQIENHYFINNVSAHMELPR